MKINKIIILLLISVSVLTLTSCNLLADRNQLLNNEDFNVIVYNGDEYLIYDQYELHNVWFKFNGDKTFIGYVDGFYFNIWKAYMMESKYEDNIISAGDHWWVKKDFKWPTIESNAEYIEISIYYKSYFVDIEQERICDIIKEVDIENENGFEILYQTSVYLGIDKCIQYMNLDVIKNDEQIYLRNEYNTLEGDYVYYEIDEKYYYDIERIINEHYQGKEYGV